MDVLDVIITIDSPGISLEYVGEGITIRIVSENESSAGNASLGGGGIFPC